MCFFICCYLVAKYKSSYKAKLTILPISYWVKKLFVVLGVTRSSYMFRSGDDQVTIKTSIQRESAHILFALISYPLCPLPSFITCDPTGLLSASGVYPIFHPFFPSHFCDIRHTDLLVRSTCCAPSITRLNSVPLSSHHSFSTSFGFSSHTTLLSIQPLSWQLE